jgi:hypothetical protein
MAKSDEVLDRVFKEKLENHEASPVPAAWDKLEAQLDAVKQPKKSTWWAIAAAMPLLLGLGYLIWSQEPQTEQENSIAAIEEVLEVPLVPDSTPEAKKVGNEAAEKPTCQNKSITPQSSTLEFKSSLPQENTKAIDLENAVAEIVTFPSPQTAAEQEVNSTTDTKALLNSDTTVPSFSTTILQPSLEEVEEVDGYRIRIFSDGLKKEAAPNKNLVTELGKTVGQLEKTISNLDNEYLKIQDKKEWIISSLTSRKEFATGKQ